jgi:hypothetical protein
MPTKEEALAKRTYKQDGLEVDKRVFYTLGGDSEANGDLQVHRSSKAIALLFKTLLEARTLTEEQLDEILLEVTW